MIAKQRILGMSIVWCTILSCVIELYTTYKYYHLADLIHRDNTKLTYVVADVFNDQVGLVGSAKTFSQVFSWIYLVLYFVWIYLAYRNLFSISAVKPRWTAAWATISMIIPPLLFWRPYQVIREIWKKSVDNNLANNATKVVFSWWATTLISITFIFYASMDLYLSVRRATSLHITSSEIFAATEMISRALFLMSYSHIFVIISSTLFGWLVYKITYIQDKVMTDKIDMDFEQ